MPIPGGGEQGKTPTTRRKANKIKITVAQVGIRDTGFVFFLAAHNEERGENPPTTRNQPKNAPGALKRIADPGSQPSSRRKEGPVRLGVKERIIRMHKNKKWEIKRKMNCDRKKQDRDGEL